MNQHAAVQRLCLVWLRLVMNRAFPARWHLQWTKGRERKRNVPLCVGEIIHLKLITQEINMSSSPRFIYLCVLMFPEIIEWTSDLRAEQSVNNTSCVPVKTEITYKKSSHVPANDLSTARSLLNASCPVTIAQLNTMIYFNCWHFNYV